MSKTIRTFGVLSALVLVTLSVKCARPGGPGQPTTGEVKAAQALEVVAQTNLSVAQLVVTLTRSGYIQPMVANSISAYQSQVAAADKGALLILKSQAPIGERAGAIILLLRQIVPPQGLENAGLNEANTRQLVAAIQGLQAAVTQVITYLQQK